MENEENVLYVIPAEILNGILTNLSEQKLKDGLNLYISIQQNVRTLDQHLGNTASSEKTPDA